MIAGQEAGIKEVERLSKGNHAESVNGWLSGLHQFDYNLDYFQIGTINSDAWKIADRNQARTTRAVSDRLALWGNHAYEAVYEQVFTDDTGEQLHGSHRYEITFTELPPVNGFWSITMYALPEYYLVANPIERYSIGDRTKGVTYRDDGSLTIYIQHERPQEDKVANWLPAPSSAFRPMMRLYEPGPAILNSSYQLPEIRRIA